MAALTDSSTLQHEYAQERERQKNNTEKEENENGRERKKKEKIEGIAATCDKLLVIYKMITTNDCNLV